ncbi:hypothetical protein D3C81_2022640 [compost metagenome]
MQFCEVKPLIGTVQTQLLLRLFSLSRQRQRHPLLVAHVLHVGRVRVAQQLFGQDCRQSRGVTLESIDQRIGRAFTLRIQAVEQVLFALCCLRGKLLAQRFDACLPIT